MERASAGGCEAARGMGGTLWAAGFRVQSLLGGTGEERGGAPGAGPTRPSRASRESGARPARSQREGAARLWGRICQVSQLNMPAEYAKFFALCSLLNTCKPTAPENGTHHTAAVLEKRTAAKKTAPAPPPLPSPSLSHLDPRRGTRSTSVAYRVSGPASHFFQ